MIFQYIFDRAFLLSGMRYFSIRIQFIFNRARPILLRICAGVLIRINDILIIMTTLICKIPPNLPLPKGGITPLWPPAHRASGPEGKEGGGEIFE